MAFDEVVSADLHQWLCCCRMLMCHHPREGARAVEIVVTGQPLYRRGWNRSFYGEFSGGAAGYVHIGDGEGSHSLKPPPDVPADQIHEVPPATPLETTWLWRKTREVSARLVAGPAFGEFTPERIAAIEAHIVRAGASDGRTHDTSIMIPRARRTVRAMGEALLATRKGVTNYRDFFMPSLDIVRACLNFELPGQIAKELLAMVLAVQCNAPGLGPPGDMPESNRVTAIEHLADAAYRLFELRKAADVTSYFTLTQLATLYVGAAVTMAGHGAEVGFSEASVKEKVARLSLNVDEFGAYNGPVTFMLPSIYPPAPLLRWTARVKQTEGQTAVDLYRIHPALFSLMDTLDVAHASDADIDGAYAKAASERRSIDVLSLIETAECAPYAKANREYVQLQILTLALGSAAGA